MSTLIGLNKFFRQYKNEGFTNREISPRIEENLDIQKVLERSSKDWDGGYAIAGLIGHGDAFVMRDPWGIRPAFYYSDDEIVVVSSGGTTIRTAAKEVSSQGRAATGVRIMSLDAGQTVASAALILATDDV